MYDQELDRLAKRIMEMLNFIDLADPSWHQLTAEQAAEVMIYKDGSPQIRLGYVLRELWITVARRLELLTFPGCHLSSGDALSLPVITLHVFPPPKHRSLFLTDTLEFLVSVADHFSRVVPPAPIFFPDDQGKETDRIEAILYSICEYRELSAFYHFAGEYKSTLQKPILDPRIKDVIPHLPTPYQEWLRQSLQHYIANDFIPRVGVYADRYQEIFGIERYLCGETNGTSNS